MCFFLAVNNEAKVGLVGWLEKKRTFFGENWTFLVPKKGRRTRRRRRELQIDRVGRRWRKGRRRKNKQKKDVI